MKKNNKTNLKAMITTMLVLAMVITLIPVSAQASSKWTNSISKTKRITDRWQGASYVIEVKKTCEVTVTATGTTGCMAWDIKKNMNDTDKAMPQLVKECTYNSKTGMETSVFKLYKGYYMVGGGEPKANYTDKVSIKSSGKNIRFVKAIYGYNSLPVDIDFDYLDAYYDKEDMCW